MHAFILAGGFATRLWPLTEHRAKPLLPLIGKPIIDHIIEKIPAGIPVTVSTNAAFEESFREWKETMRREQLSVHIEQVMHDDAKLGALGATAAWIQNNGIQEDILLLTGDNYFGFDMQAFLGTQRKDTPLIAAYDVGDLAKASRFGTIILNDDGKTAKAFEEKPKEPKSSLVSTGCTVIPASALPILVEYAQIHPDNVGGIFEELLRRGITVDCFQFKDPWFDIGTFDSYLEATKTMVGDRVLLGENARMEQSQSEHSVVVGKGSEIIKSTLKNTVVFDDCFIEECTLENCILDNRCVLRGVDLQNKMIRADTTIVLPKGNR